MTNTPFHNNELTVQQRAGTSEQASNSARLITDRIPAGAMTFVEQQAMAVIGSLDQQGRIWASVLFGNRNFMKPYGDQRIEIDRSQSWYSPSDPLWQNILEMPDVGMLLIELSTRRRLRVNGKLNKESEHRYALKVEQAYPNCPKYIQRRVLDIQPQQSSITDEQQAGTSLESSQLELIRTADTFFVASANAEQAVDASHRGGKPGFVQIKDAQTLRIPDYPGNGMFNTLGNFTSHPYAGLVFIDFSTNRVLQITGKPTILWDQDEVNEETGGTKRFWQFSVTEWRENNIPVEIHWQYIDASPFNPEVFERYARIDG